MSKLRPLIRKICSVVYTESCIWWLAWEHGAQSKHPQMQSEKRSTSEGSLKSELCSTSGALGVALTFVNQSHWLLGHAGSHGVSKIVHMGKSHWLPSSQVPGLFLKKCGAWCCSRALNWLGMSCIPDLGADSHCCAWPPGKAATPQVSQTRLRCNWRGQSYKWRHQSATQTLDWEWKDPRPHWSWPLQFGTKSTGGVPVTEEVSGNVSTGCNTKSLHSFECLNKMWSWHICQKVVDGKENC